MASTPTTDEVLASARKDLQVQLAVVRDEISRLAAEERALTQALSSLDGDSTASSTTAPATDAGGQTMKAKRSSRSSKGKAGTRRRRGRRGASKSTADRVNELRVLLADSPKSRNDLAAALKVSPARIQQLLAELGSAVSSQPDPAQRRGTLWTLTAPDNGASAAKPTGRRGGGKGKATSTRKPAARRKQAGN